LKKWYLEKGAQLKAIICVGLATPTPIAAYTPHTHAVAHTSMKEKFDRFWESVCAYITSHEGFNEDVSSWHFCRLFHLDISQISRPYSSPIPGIRHNKVSRPN